MKAIKTLLKLSKKNLDQLLLRKKNLEQNLNEAEHKLKSLQEEIKAESQNFANTEYAFFIEGYIKGAGLKTKNFEAKIASLTEEIKNLNLEIMEVFGEIKRYEIISQKHKKAAQEKTTKTEMQTLDELTIIKFNGNAIVP